MPDTCMIHKKSIKYLKPDVEGIQHISRAYLIVKTDAKNKINKLLYSHLYQCHYIEVNYKKTLVSHEVNLNIFPQKSKISSFE